MVRILALVLLAVAHAQPQACYSYRSCSSCIAAGCYAYVSGECAGSCTDRSTDSCSGVAPTKNAGSCPAPPSNAALAGSRSSAAGVVGLGAAAAALTAFFTYAGLERFCGQKAEAPAAAPFRTWLLFAGSSFLWLGLALQLASPLLPWMACSYAIGSDGAYFTIANAFSLQGCERANNGDTVCQEWLSWSDYLVLLASQDYSFGVPQDARALMAEAQALGTYSFVFATALLSPAAVMVSVAVYRLQRYNTSGIAPYVSGFAPASLFVAQLLGWASFGVFCVLWWSALLLCSTVATKYTGNCSNGFSYNNLPGEITAGVGFSLQLAGLAAVAIEARALKDVPGVGCNTAGCARLKMTCVGDSEEGAYSRAPLEDYARAPQMAAPAPDEASRYPTPKFLVAHSLP